MPSNIPAVSAVPHRMRLVCAVIAAVVVVGMVLGGIFLKTSDPTGTVAFRTGDQVALICLGLLIAAGILLLGRPRVDGDADGVRVRNILGSHRISWEQVRSVRFDRNSMWASLSLTSGEEIAVLAVQAADRERAVAAVDGLRALLDASRPAAEPGPPLLYDN